MKVTTVALAAAAVATTVLAQDGPTTADILNFALNLECLEAEFYSWAAFGEGLTEAQRGGGPESIGGMMANLTGLYMPIAKEIALDEIAHVDLLRAALGDAAVACPLMDIGPAFAAAANAAAGATLDPAFDPYANDVFFLHGAFIFEDVGVTAYGGAVEPLVTLGADGATLSVAARVMAVEAYHAGIVRDQLYYLDTLNVTTPYGPIRTVVQLISDLRDAVDGDDDLDQGIVATDGSGDTTLVPTDENALTFLRTVAQILPIVYLGGDAETGGGFYPEGLTGFFGPSSQMMDSGSETMCAKRYEQCGGRNFEGPTCCFGNSVCVVTNPFYSGCRPGPAMDGVVPFFKGCSMEDGADPCEEGSTCTMKTANFNQCVPDS